MFVGSSEFDTSLPGRSSRGPFTAVLPGLPAVVPRTLATKSEIDSFCLVAQMSQKSNSLGFVSNFYSVLPSTFLFLPLSRASSGALPAENADFLFPIGVGRTSLSPPREEPERARCGAALRTHSGVPPQRLCRIRENSSSRASLGQNTLSELTFPETSQEDQLPSRTAPPVSRAPLPSQGPRYRGRSFRVSPRALSSAVSQGTACSPFPRCSAALRARLRLSGGNCACSAPSWSGKMETSALFLHFGAVRGRSRSDGGQDCRCRPSESRHVTRSQSRQKSRLT